MEEKANQDPKEEQSINTADSKTDEKKSSKKGSSINGRIIFLGLLIALIITFTLQNNAEVEVNFLFWKFTSVRAVIIFLSFGLGWLSAFIYGLVQKSKKK